MYSSRTNNKGIRLWRFPSSRNFKKNRKLNLFLWTYLVWVAIFDILSRMHHQADWLSAAKSALTCDRDRSSQVLNFLGIFLFFFNNKGVCTTIRTHPSFHSLSFGYRPWPAHIQHMGQVFKAIHRKCWKDFSFPFKIADNWYQE